MQSKLEDVLQEKEKELKLYQRFLDLKSLCEDDIFPSADLPLREHVSSLKALVERIIPDPRDRKEELFSGEIFALLGTIFLHDIGLAKEFKWEGDQGVFDALDKAHRKVLINDRIGRRLDIPERAMEIINRLSFSDMIRKVPIEWVILEDGGKAIIRNTRVIGHIFNFSHFLLDTFYSDFRYPPLRRYQYPKLTLSNRHVAMDIDSREGIIYINADARSPYELHEIESAKPYVNDAFNFFKRSVNGRLGLQYREIKWEVAAGFDGSGSAREGRTPEARKEEKEWPLASRWEEASSVLDRVFDLGYAMIVGEASVGKTTTLKSFVLPQISSLSPNVFYCELWENPVREIRDEICERHRTLFYSRLDIISICRTLLEDGPCLFVLDGCERVVSLEGEEKEKLERFLNFCLDQENVYLIVSGDKENFFDWFTFFNRMNMSAICEIKPVRGPGSALHETKPDIEKVLGGILNEVDDMDEFRGIMASLVDTTSVHLKRYAIDAIHFETCIPRTRVLQYLNILKRAGLVRETELAGTVYISLSSRHMREPVYRILELEGFSEKKRIRERIRGSLITESFLDGETLKNIGEWKEQMVFSREGMGLILSSLIFAGVDYRPFFEKAIRDGNRIDIQPILKFLDSGDGVKRREAVKLLVDIGDKNAINPLLTHLRRETAPEIKEILIKGIGRTGKKKAIHAIVQALRETGERDLRLEAIRLCRSFLKKDARTLLLDIREKEEDPLILEELDNFLSTQET